MSTQAYYKDRLGFDPREESLREAGGGGGPVNGNSNGQFYQRPQHNSGSNGHGKEHGASGPHDQVYEENLTKFKGTTCWGFYVEQSGLCKRYFEWCAHGFFLPGVCLFWFDV